MGLYVIKLQHTSEACPTANTKARERMIKGTPEVPRSWPRSWGSEFVAGPLVLGSPRKHRRGGNRPNRDGRRFILQDGLMQWNTIHVFAAKTAGRVDERLGEHSSASCTKETTRDRSGTRRPPRPR